LDASGFLSESSMLMVSPTTQSIINCQGISWNKGFWLY